MPHPPDALLLIATGCGHCPAMLEHFGRLIKQGRIGRLEVINIAERPEIAQQLEVRGVPWFQIGGLSFSGLMAFHELAELVKRIAKGGGQPDHLVHLLENQGLPEATALLREQPDLLLELVPLLGDLERPMQVRIGIGALIEELSGDPALTYAMAPLLVLSNSTEPQTRADAAHYLGLCGDTAAIPALRVLLEDDHPSVREIAAESLALLKAWPTSYN